MGKSLNVFSKSFGGNWMGKNLRDLLLAFKNGDISLDEIENR